MTPEGTALKEAGTSPRASDRRRFGTNSSMAWREVREPGPMYDRGRRDRSVVYFGSSGKTGGTDFR